ncbi:SGNH/GDSL hydrolase family protein [Streptococcus pneumoniae]|uniref:SGNH/GDSL hydrolase family protein n=5 Tax=Streptococcus pneumoniae TaxID=1313 RepID=UPI0005EA4CC6|nr:SGNH/GDSL hydrolase family protein [Streptococcus pneumoniae]AZF89608.1 pectin esterase [Streptococcus phage 109751]MDS3669751.1 SGNH/GDSL hydrolase family protein [Streptococcus pneumoniae]MDS6138483.1 SGNH/GDSL hydrolase family protein [Streptococcus pneumoniae]MDS9217011.1 SGNH/GDSL hydrolase family protein [Streptococcus pneumoniae]MDT5806781.1 SGNH/GDSL hydrolase family protein [Streptococcus pneumoniae]
MTTEEATGRLNLYDDPSPLPKTDNINILVDGIRKKTRGADVRESIAKALEVTYETASKDGNANMEVAKARGGFDTLSQNLLSINASADAANQKASQLINDKVDKNGAAQVTWAMLAQDAREQIAGNKVAVVGNNAVSSANIVNGSVTDAKLDERMGFGLMLAGRLTIDAKNSTVTLASGSWFQVGKRKASVNENLSASLPKETVSQYVIYNDKTHELYVRNLRNISNIGNRETILAILYNGVLVHPQSSPFVKTIGLKIGERSDYIDANWGTLIQGKIIFDPKSRTIRGQREGNDFIISFDGYFINGIDEFELTFDSPFGRLLLFDRDSKTFQLTTMYSYSQYQKTEVPKTATLIKVAEIYFNEIRHISHERNFVNTNKPISSKKTISLEQIKIDLQTKRTIIVTLGDSTTDGFRTTGYSGNVLERLSDKPKSYTEILNNIINSQKGYSFNHKFYNRGFSGKTINWLRQNLDAVLSPISEKIDYVFIAMGINDMVYNENTLKSFKEDHIEIANSLILKGIKPVFMSTQAEFENHKRFGSKINAIADNVKKDLAAELGIPFIDYNEGTRNILNNSEYKIKELIPDMCHFGDLGHQKGAEFLASQLIHQTAVISESRKVGYQNNKVVSDLNYSDYLTDDQDEVKFIERTDGFDLEGQLNSAQTKKMFEVSVYIERPSIIRFFGDNVIVTSNGQSLSDGTVLDVGFYRITAKNRSGIASKFRGLKFNLKEV